MAAFREKRDAHFDGTLSGPAARMERLQRVAAYNVCVDDASRLLMCRLSDITERPGCVDAARRRHRLRRAPRGGRAARARGGDRPHRPDRRAARRRLAPTSGARAVGEPRADYHSVRIVYRTEITGGELRHETDESTDRAAWCTREDLDVAPARRARPPRRLARLRRSPVSTSGDSLDAHPDPVQLAVALAPSGPPASRPARLHRASTGTS